MLTVLLVIAIVGVFAIITVSGGKMHDRNGGEWNDSLLFLPG